MIYKGLYEQFNRWYHGGDIFFYSDPHFADEEMKYLRKNYIGDEEQVKRINSVIGKNDTIIFLGDIGDPEWIKRIRGYKVLIMGNHDETETKFTPYFNEIYKGGLIISDKIILTHEPVSIPWLFNIHGHDHANWFKGENHFNMCAEHIDYTPVRFGAMIKGGLFSKVPSIHRITIDNAIERKARKEK